MLQALIRQTRKALKACVENECRDMRDAHGFGGSKAEIAHIVAHVWREAKAKRKPYLPYAIGFRRSRDANDRPFGVFIGHATRAEFVEFCKENDEY